MEVKAIARYIRMSPRKVRLVADIIRGARASEALLQLQFIRKRAAAPVSKLLKSAMANAENNFKLNPSELFVKKITVDGGPVLKRFRARAFGRAAPIRKRSSHITIVLEEKESAKLKQNSKKITAKS
ncbi:50S ribosomal protein L22 [Candidatus Uhrbacteria bacterium]|nr:50S ribosomal protein L22 [Candidatus Uhrbacteria bacterium]